MSAVPAGEPHRGRAFRVAERARERLELALALRQDAAGARRAFAATLEAPSLHPDLALALRGELALAEAALQAGGDALRAHAAEHDLGGLRLWTTSGGARILRLRAETFPGHVNYAYALDLGDTRVLWDVGTGMGDSRQDLLDGLAAAARTHGFALDLPDVDVVLISHGHIDHFGDVRWFLKATGAELWVHELDARVLEHWAERTVLGGRDMRGWLVKAGLRDERIQQLVTLYLASKELYSSDGLVVDRRLRHGQRLFGDRARVIHTPGHCPGHVCLRLDDALLVADQVLAPTTPHISPQALHPHNGLERYLDGLGRLRLEQGVRHVLPAHYDEIPDLGARIDAIAQHHAEQTQVVLGLCHEPRTVAEVAKDLYGRQEGYNVLLALLEAGAHVEYLHQVGTLIIANLDELVEDPRAAVSYCAAATAAPVGAAA